MWNLIDTFTVYISVTIFSAGQNTHVHPMTYKIFLNDVIMDYTINLYITHNKDGSVYSHDHPLYTWRLTFTTNSIYE